MGIHFKLLLGYYSTEFESNDGSEGMASKENVLSSIFPHHLFSNPEGFIETRNFVYLLEDEIEIVAEIRDNVCRWEDRTYEGDDDG